MFADYWQRGGDDTKAQLRAAHRGKVQRRSYKPLMELLEDRVVPAELSHFLTFEHADLNIGFNKASNTWALGPRDNDAIPAVQYGGDEALLYVGEDALTTRPAGATFDFIGVGAGQPFYRLPQTQNANLLYLGFAAHDVQSADFDNYDAATESGGRATGVGPWLKASLVSVSGPGAFSIWQSEDTGPNVFIASSDGITGIDALWVVAGGHSHFNLGFTAVGRYEVTFQLSGHVDTDGNNSTDNNNVVTSPNQTVYFSVGNVGQLEFDASTYTVNEGAGTAAVTVRRINGSDGRITVGYATSDDSALAGEDYTNSNDTLTFNDLQTQKVINVPINDDSDPELNQVFHVLLSGPGPASIASYVTSIEASSLLAATTTTAITIVDNDSISNTSPIANEDAYTLAAGNSLVGNVLFNDTDDDGDNMTAAPTLGPTKGALFLNPNGSFSYIPGLAFDGSDNFTYEVSDGNGGSDTAVVAITASPPSDFQAVLTHQHADIGLAFEADAWDLHVHDESNNAEYAPDEALLYVGPQALMNALAGAGGT